MNVKFKKGCRIIGALTGIIALVIQFYLTIAYSPESGLSYLQSVIKFFSFMTILTNILVTLTYLIPLLSPESKLGLYLESPFSESGVLVYILIVGIIYHLILANVWNPKGLQLFADILLHTVIPFMYLIYWILFTEKGTQKYVNCIKWLIYPLIYVIYILIRGALSGMYPYPFLNVTVLGFTSVLQNIFLITLCYVIIGAFIIFADRLFSR